MRAAIVGLGSWGRTLVTSVEGASDEIRFVAGATRTPANAEGFCREHDIRLVGNFDELLRDGSVDAVVLATPNSQHEGQVTAAAAAGKHVFVEKPLALTSASARAAIDAVNRAGVTIGIGLNRRFHPTMQELQRRVTSGALGVIGTVLAELTATTGFYRAATSWRVNAEEEPAGAMASIGVHLVDAMIWMLGRVCEVHCVAARRGGPHGNDTTSLMLEFECGATGLVYCSVAAARNFRIAAYGSQGFAEVLTPAMDTFRYIPATVGRTSHLARIPEPEVIQSPGYNSVAAELITFARCVRERKAYPIPIEDVLHGVDVFEAAVESATTHRIVNIRRA